MPLVSVPAVLMGTASRCWKRRPVRPYRVLVTFVEPADAATLRAHNKARFLASFGAWRDDRPVEETLRDIHERPLPRS